MISGAIALRISQRITTGMVTMRMTNLTNHQAMRIGLTKILKNFFMSKNWENRENSTPLALAGEQLVDFFEEQADHPEDGFDFVDHDSLGE